MLGVTAEPQIEHGQETLTVMPADGVSRLALSSTARDRIVVVGLPCAAHVYDHLTVCSAGVVSVAGCQVAPPSVETSTPATTPPPVSVAVPVIVTALPS